MKTKFLYQKSLSTYIYKFIIQWYADLRCRVRWGDATSDWFSIKAGVRQGGVLSPDFYCIYVDQLVQIISAMGIGCHLKDMFLSILLYADDIALIAPTLTGLQKLLTVAEMYCKESLNSLIVFLVSQNKFLAL